MYGNGTFCLEFKYVDITSHIATLKNALYFASELFLMAMVSTQNAFSNLKLRAYLRVVLIGLRS